MRLEDKLIELGTYIAVLGDETKKELKNTLSNILDKCSKGNENSKQIFGLLIQNMIKNEEQNFVGGTFKFLHLLGYEIKQENTGLCASQL